MLPAIIIGAFVLAILWPFIKLGYELIKLAGSLALLVASCAIGAVALVDAGPGPSSPPAADRRERRRRSPWSIRPRPASAFPRSPNTPRCARGTPEGTEQTKRPSGIYLERTMP